MRCIGPYTASSLFAQGLAWEYGPDAGGNIPDDGPVADPMPDSVPSIQGIFGGVGEFGVETMNDWVWRRLGGLMVYAVMIALVGVTLAAGSRLPEVPWKAPDPDSSDDEFDDADDDQRSNELDD